MSVQQNQLSSSAKAEDPVTQERAVVTGSSAGACARAGEAGPECGR
jgi:hypothetical protein